MSGYGDRSMSRMGSILLVSLGALGSFRFPALHANADELPRLAAVTYLESEGSAETIAVLDEPATIRIEYSGARPSCENPTTLGGCYKHSDNAGLRYEASAAGLVVEHLEGGVTFWFVSDQEFWRGCAASSCPREEHPHVFFTQDLGERDTPWSKIWQMPAGEYRIALLALDGSPVSATLNLTTASGAPAISEIEVSEPTQAALRFDHRRSEGIVEGDEGQWSFNTGDGGFAALGYQFDTGPTVATGVLDGEADFTYGFPGWGLSTGRWKPVYGAWDPVELSQGGIRVLSEVFPPGFDATAVWRLTPSMIDLKRSAFLLVWPTAVGTDGASPPTWD